MPESLIEESRWVGDVLVVRLVGELTMAHTPALQAELAARITRRRPSRLVMDMAGVRFIDSSGLAMLIELRKSMGNNGICLAGMVREVARLVSIMKLDALFDCQDALDPDLHEKAG